MLGEPQGVSKTASAAIRMVFDGDILLRDRYGGVSRILSETKRALHARSDVRVGLPFLFYTRPYFSLSCFGKVNVSRWPEFRGSTMLAALNSGLMHVASLGGHYNNIRHATFYERHPRPDSTSAASPDGGRTSQPATTRQTGSR
jgi:hypothetical protein